MDYGFDSQGKAVAMDSPECSYILADLDGRPMFRRADQAHHGVSMYHFGVTVYHAIRSGFDWSAVLTRLPKIAPEANSELRAKLLGERDCVMALVEEIGAKSFTEETLEDLVELFSVLYPAYGHFEDQWSFLSDNFYGFDPSWKYRRFHTAPDFKTMIEEAFGTYRKDLARVASTKSGSAIALLSLFKDSVTTEQIIELLNLDLPEGGWGALGCILENRIEDHLEALNLLPRNVRFRLIEEIIEAMGSDEEGCFALGAMIQDALAMLSSVPVIELKRFRSDRTWDQVHNRALVLADDSTIEKIEPLELPRALRKIDGLELQGGMTLKLLRSPMDFFRAGSRSGLDNCMGKAGYYTKAKNGESYCFVGYRAGVLVAGIELEVSSESWKVLQLNGPKNQIVANRREVERELLQLLNGEESPTLSLSDPQLEEAVYEEIQDPIVLRARDGEQDLGAIDIPPLAELTEGELATLLYFTGARADGDLEAAPLRQLTMAQLREAVGEERLPNHFALQH